MFSGVVTLMAVLATAVLPLAGSDNQKAAKAIWRHSKSWKLKARKPGGLDAPAPETRKSEIRNQPPATGHTGAPPDVALVVGESSDGISRWTVPMPPRYRTQRT